MWKAHWGYFQNVEQQPDEEHRAGAVNLRNIYPQEWSTLRSLQMLFGDEEVTVITQDAEAQPPAGEAASGQPGAERGGAEGQWSAGTPHSPGALSPIAEGSHEDSTLGSLDSYLLHDDPDLQAVLAQTRCQFDCVLATCPFTDGGSKDVESSVKDELDDRMPIGLLGSTELLTLSIAPDSTFEMSSMTMNRCCVSSRSIHPCVTPCLMHRMWPKTKF